MIQEIMFKGKRADNGEWVYGRPFKINESDRHFISPIGSNIYNSSDNEQFIIKFHGMFISIEAIEVVPKTVGQFTGLTDNNGIKIYEGDILATEKRDVMFIIIWDRFSCGFKFKDNFDGCLLNIDLKALRKIEVIGNVHDNPELLENGDNNES